MKNCTPSWREADLEVKKLKTPHAWNIFGQLRCGKSAQRCGAKCEALFVVKMQKKNTFRPLLEVEMSKKCTLLWREAHFEVNMLKNTAVSEYFWKSGAKSARCCGTKHIWKSNA